MDIGFYALIVALAALVYSFIARALQMKLVDRDAMKGVQDESKRLSDEMKKARERNDKARMDKLMEEQMAMLPKMNKVMMDQFKPMIAILVVFFAFNTGISHFNPAAADDLALQLYDDGRGCDRAAGDGTWSGCFNISGTGYGKWVVDAKAMEGGSVLAENRTFFLYNIANASDTFVHPPSGAPMGVATDRQEYFPGDTVAIYASGVPAKASSVAATLDSGTSFYVDLPFTIPVLDFRRFHDTNWWFIFITLLAGIALSVALGQLEKRGVKVL